MSRIDAAYDIVTNFQFKANDYSEAGVQFLRFSEEFVQLNASEADTLRSVFDSKDRFTLFGIAASVFRERIEDSEKRQKSNLCRIFFALYSFDNLEFGYDSLLYLEENSGKFKKIQELAKESWLPFKALTTNELAWKNLENKIFTSKFRF